MARTLNVSIAANEVLPTGTPIEVTSEDPLDPRSAQATITLDGERALVRLSDDRRTARVLDADGEELRPGRHVLQVGELLSENRARVDAEGIRIPFLVIDTNAQIPDDVRLDAVVRLGVEELRTERLPVDERPDRSFIEIFKAFYRSTGERVDLAFDQDGNRIDAGEILARVERNRLERFGKVQEDLHDRIAREPSEPVTVAIWLRTPPRTQPVEKPLYEESREPQAVELQEDEETRELSERFARVARETFGAEVMDPDPTAPLLIATLPGERVRALAERDEVAAVLIHSTEAILDLGTSMAIAHSDQVQSAGFDGSGISVAVWEDGPDVVTQLPIVATFDTAVVGTSQHSRHTHAIVANTEPGQPHGHAPECSLHSANQTTIAALRWAVRDRGCTVISQSFHRTIEATSPNLQSDDLYKDWLALHTPFPTIVQAAGNYFAGDSDAITPPADEYVNHKTFNCLVVGNHDDTAGAMSGDSVFRNPASPTRDRELPDICANGATVTTVGLTMSGTSMATPAVAGCVALLQDVDPVLKSWPEGCRAIVMAGARRTPGSADWFTDVQDHRDSGQGAGAIDAMESLDITRSRRGPGARAGRCGWDVRTLRNTDITSRGEATFIYNVIAPTLMHRPALKVALAWDSVVLSSLPGAGGNETPLSSTLANDLDLLVYNSAGTLSAQSSSFDNSYEIADVRLTAGASYTIRIRAYAHPSDVWYGIAWRVSPRPISFGG